MRISDGSSDVCSSDLAGGNGAAELSVAEHRAQLRQTLGRGVRARALVVLDQQFLQADGVAAKVGLVRDDLARRDLVAELAGLDRGQRLLVRAQRERVLVLARPLDRTSVV